MKALDKIRSLSKKAVDARNDLQVSVEELRNELFRLRGERQHFENAPMSRAETVEKIKGHLDYLETEAVRRLTPGAFRSVSSPGRVEANADDAFAISAGIIGGPATPFISSSSNFKGVGGLCALGLRPLIEKALLDRSMEALPGDGLSESDRAAKLRKVDVDIDAVERAEEELIRDAEAAGIVVHRRRDARPEIFLAETL